MNARNYVYKQTHTEKDSATVLQIVNFRIIRKDDNDDVDDTYLLQYGFPPGDSVR